MGDTSTMSEDGFGKFGVNAWTPERTALWNALNVEERKELEEFVAQGSDAPVPPKWKEKTVELRGETRESTVPTRLVEHMKKNGWTDAVIESVYGRYYRKD